MLTGENRADLGIFATVPAQAPENRLLFGRRITAGAQATVALPKDRGPKTGSHLHAMTRKFRAPASGRTFLHSLIQEHGS